jgi:ATP-dependent DNA helicase DinG
MTDSTAAPSSAPSDTLSPLDAFEHAVHNLGFRRRDGQREMAEHIVATIGVVDLTQPPPEDAIGASSDHADVGPPQRAIAVVQAGTGVGKSAAYVATVVPMALSQGKRVLIATATVALQEQLMAKDLPRLSQALPQPFTYALAKGRGRYVCRLKLDQLSAGDASSANLFDADAPPPSDTPTDSAASAREAERWEARARHYALWGKALDAGTWDGDRDRLDDPPEAELWVPVAAERHSCSARHCPSYHGCSYYRARAQLAQANVIVVNHDLLLSTLGLHALPDPSDCFVVFDEAHHLPQVAQGQFTAQMDLMRSAWLDRLPKAVSEVAAALAERPEADVPTLTRELKTAIGELARLAMQRVGELPEWAAASRPPRAGAPEPAPVVDRFAQGRLPEGWAEAVDAINTRASALLKVFESLATLLKANARDNPGDAPRCAQLYSRLGAIAPRLQQAQETTALWLQDTADGQPPLAKWMEAGVRHGLVTLTAHASPLLPGGLLRYQLWSKVRAAVLTSASLTSCGTFHHFLHEVGLAGDAAVSTREAQSPFDHANQGRLIVVDTQADPKDLDAYNAEVLQALWQDLREVQRGALVLFTSRAQLRQAQLQLERGDLSDLRERILVQGDASRTRLLQQHADRVHAGQPSVLFGLQSFGEGLDLPGELCEWVFITKLPFASPGDPVGQARADWLKAQGRDPFADIVVPTTGARLLQWTGRALRTETDQAVVVCYDPRLLRQAYGRRMLAGLPPYRLQRRVKGVVVDVG